jgi:hypothetical protein
MLSVPRTKKGPANYRAFLLFNAAVGHLANHPAERVGASSRLMPGAVSQSQCRLWIIGGHRNRAGPCPPFPPKAGVRECHRLAPPKIRCNARTFPERNLFFGWEHRCTAPALCVHSAGVRFTPKSGHYFFIRHNWNPSLAIDASITSNYMPGPELRRQFFAVLVVRKRPQIRR